MGLAELGTIAVDGTKDYASRHEAMSCGHMLEAAAELKSQVEAPLNMARTADEAEENESGLDIPAEPARRRDQLAAPVAARTTPEQRRRDADLDRGRSDDDDHRPNDEDGKPKGPKGGRYKRPFGVPHHEDQDNCTDLGSRIMPHAGGAHATQASSPASRRRPALIAQARRVRKSSIRALRAGAVRMHTYSADAPGGCTIWHE